MENDIVPAENLIRVCKHLRYDEGFDCLSLITGTDRGDSFEMAYHLFSYGKKETVVLKVNAPKNAPLVPTVSKIWASANWMERETFDLLGINFLGHPTLKRILLPDDWIGHPLRKDYVEQKEYNGMSTTR